MNHTRPKNKRDDAEREEIVRLWLSGQSASEIAKAVKNGLTKNAVVGIVNRMGHSCSPERKALIHQQVNVSRARAVIVKPPRLAVAVVAVVNPSAPKARTMPPPVDPTLSASLIPLEQLRLSSCHYPVGDPGADRFGFCPEKSNGGPYCKFHHAICYNPLPLKKVRLGGRELRT